MPGMKCALSTACPHVHFTFHMSVENYVQNLFVRIQGSYMRPQWLSSISILLKITGASFPNHAEKRIHAFVTSWLQFHFRFIHPLSIPLWSCAGSRDLLEPIPALLGRKVVVHPGQVASPCSTLDRCPYNSLKMLQVIQKAAATVLTGLAKRDHISPVLLWLPVQF